MEQYLTETRNTEEMGTPKIQKLYEFPNGYGASVIKGRFSYGGDKGLWELAVTHGDGICYGTPITDDVIGHLNDSEVEETLKSILALPSKEEASNGQ